MKKRILCLLLSFLLLLSMFASTVFAATELEASEDCMAVLKKIEGFTKYPTYDFGQYMIGYGNICPDGKLQYYRDRGITEKEAEELFRTSLDGFEASVNRFASRNNLKLNQHQFDALLMFTYNVGTAWLSESSELKDAILSGATGNDLIFYLSRWCTANYQVLTGLVKRRLAEADLFLNGNYSANAPSHYSYVSFEANGGVCTSRVQGYDASNPPAVKAVPTRTGYRFLGWYTEEEGGEWITDLDALTEEITLYAHWQLEDGNMADGKIQGTPCEYKRRTNSASALSVYEVPNASEPFAHLDAGIQVKIVADYVDSAGAKWGKMAGGGWINLGTTHQLLHPAAKTVKTNMKVKVTSDSVHVRSGAGVTYDIVGNVNRGSELIISETKPVGQVMWGYYSGGWISLEHTDYTSAEKESDSSTDTSLMGTVLNCTSLRIRSGPGVGYVTVGQLSSGTTVEITQIKSVGAAQWGRISKGWISLSYVKLQETTPTVPEQDTEGDTSVECTGMVTNCNKLNVRSGAGISYPKVASLESGTVVTVYETTNVNGSIWGRIRQGWINMKYVKQSAQTDAIVGTVVGTSSLRIRKGAGTNYPQVGSLTAGNQVKIYETTTVRDVQWGRMDQGWVCMSYIRTEGSETVLGTVTADSLRIRSAAGTTHDVVGSYNYGTQVEILETTQVDGVAWGRTNQGWICMSYVKY